MAVAFAWIASALVWMAVVFCPIAVVLEATAWLTTTISELMCAISDSELAIWDLTVSHPFTLPVPSGSANTVPSSVLPLMTPAFSWVN